MVSIWQFAFSETAAHHVSIWWLPLIQALSSIGFSMDILHIRCKFTADKYYIRRFLRARQHDLDKAQQMYADHIRWRKEFNVAGIVNDFKFTERDLFLTLYPQGYHKTDKLVSVTHPSCSLGLQRSKLSSPYRLASVRVYLRKTGYWLLFDRGHLHDMPRHRYLSVGISNECMISLLYSMSESVSHAATQQVI